MVAARDVQVFEGRGHVACVGFFAGVGGEVEGVGVSVVVGRFEEGWGTV